MTHLLHTHRLNARCAAFAVALACLLGSAAQAETAADETPNATRWTLGLGLATEQQPYRGVDRRVRAMPLVLAEGSWFSIAGTTADLKLPMSVDLSLRLRARYAFDGYEADDSPALAGMQDRDGGLWLGAAAMWRTPLATLSAEALADGSGRSEGRRTRLGLERSFMLGSFAISPRLAATRQDDRAVDYYYGVRADEMRPGRPAHRGRATTSIEAGLRLAWRFASRQGLAVDVAHTRHGRGIQASPIVEHTSGTGLRVAWLNQL